MADLAELAAEYGVTLHAYADDNQLLIHCKAENTQTSVESLEECVEAISGWMLANRLKINVDKTEFVWTGSERNLQSLCNCGKTNTEDRHH